MGDVQKAAAVLLKWMDDYADPGALSLAIAQADEACTKAFHASGSVEAAQAALCRRFVESIALDNASLIRKLTPREARDD